MRAALDAGFYIVPNFPSEVFAIRTTRPAIGEASSIYGQTSAIRQLPRQKAEALDIDEGQYRSPTPRGYVTAIEQDDKHRHTYVSANDFGAIEFPFALAKTEILTATEEAMALKIFDEFAALPASKKADPMIVGRIIRPWKRQSWESADTATGQRHLSFLVVWWLDTRTV